MVILIKDIPNDSDFINVDDIKRIPNSGGIYKFYDNENKLLYLGKATSLKNRIGQHLRNSRNSNTKDIKHNFKKIKYCVVENLVDRDILETYLINLLKPKLNINKVYTYKSEYGLDQYKSKKQMVSEKIFQSQIDETLKSFYI